MAIYFNASEFEAVSHRRLSDRERGLVSWWGDLLDPVRRVVGPLRVTSYVRIGGGSHGDGSAVDIQPVVGGSRRIRAIADLVASMYLPTGQLVQVIYEAPEPGQLRAHVHLARRLVSGARPGYLQDREGNRRYVAVPVPPMSPQLVDAARPGAASSFLGEAFKRFQFGTPRVVEGSAGMGGEVRSKWSEGALAVAAGGSAIALLTLLQKMGYGR